MRFGGAATPFHWRKILSYYSCYLLGIWHIPRKNIINKSIRARGLCPTFRWSRNTMHLLVKIPKQRQSQFSSRLMTFRLRLFSFTWKINFFMHIYSIMYPDLLILFFFFRFNADASSREGYPFCIFPSSTRFGFVNKSVSLLVRRYNRKNRWVTDCGHPGVFTI